MPVAVDDVAYRIDAQLSLGPGFISLCGDFYLRGFKFIDMFRTQMKAALLVLFITLWCVGNSWAQTGIKLTPLPADNVDEFGRAVSIDGDYALVSAREDDNQGWGFVYVYKREGDSWVKQTILTAWDAIEGDFNYFGEAVSLNGDYALIGARPDGTQNGGAYIFKREGEEWVQQAKFDASDRYERFGSAVSLSGDHAIIGAHGASSQTGAAYIFKREGAQWIEQAKLTASDGFGDSEEGYSGQKFGRSVSLSGDYAIVGAAASSSLVFGSSYVFKREGSDWVEQAKLTASDRFVDDRFGSSVSIDGDNAVVGSIYKAAYVFKREGSDWIEQQRFSATGTGFGSTVSIKGDYVLFGNQEDNGFEGSVYLFGHEVGAWNEYVKLTPPDADQYMENSAFGSAVAMDGSHAIIGSLGDNEVENLKERESGAAYIYSLETIAAGIAIEGIVYDLSLDTTDDGGGQLLRTGLAGATVELFEIGELKTSTTTNQEGAFAFADLVDRTEYEIQVSASAVVPGIEESVTYDTFLAATPGETYEVALPVGLAVQSITALEALSNLTIKSDLLLGLAPPISLSRNYVTAEAQSLVGLIWELEYSNNPESIKEAMARQLIAAYLMDGLFDNASEMTHEVSQSVFAFVEGWISTKQVIDEINNALGGGVLTSIYEKIDGLIYEVFIDVPVKYAGSLMPAPYGATLSKAVIAMREALYREPTEGTSVTRNFIDNLVKDQIKNLIITTGDRVYLSSLYVPDTEEDLGEAVSKVRQFTYSGELSEAYQRTLPPAGGSVLGVSNTLTDEVKAASDELQIVGLATSKIADIIGYASVVPGWGVMTAVSRVLQGASLTSYGLAAGKAGKRLWEIDQEVTTGINLVINPAASGKTSGAAPFTYDVSSAYNSQQLSAYQKQLAHSAEEYLALLNEILELVNSGQREQALGLLEDLVALDSQYQSIQLIAQSPILAAAGQEIDANENFEESFFNLSDANYSATFNRVLLYTLMLAYAGDDVFDINELTMQADSVAAAFENLETRVAEANVLIEEVEVPAVLVVKEHSTSVSDIVPGELFEVSAVITNAGSVPGGSGFVRLQVDSLAIVLSAPQLEFTSIDVNEEIEMSWSVQVADTLFDEGGYLIELDIEDGKAFSSVGTFQIALETESTSIEDTVVPQRFTLKQNYPNPFNGTTSISYDLQAPSRVTLTIYDMLGREVATLVDSDQATGRYVVDFNGDQLPSGNYFYRLVTEEFVDTMIMTLAR